jgi:hypothetical protein
MSTALFLLALPALVVCMYLLYRLRHGKLERRRLEADWRPDLDEHASIGAWSEAAHRSLAASRERRQPHEER